MAAKNRLSANVAESEPHNPTDKLAVAVMKSDITIGHVPYNVASIISNFLKRSFNKGTAEITGDKVNHGDGYGLEVPYTYTSLWTESLHTERQKDDKEKTRMRLGSSSALPEN